MNNTKIEWTDKTLNYVVGCKRGCPFCYGKRINDRFGMIENWNEPQWFEKRYNKPLPARPLRIFLDSMSDICYWKHEWIIKTIDKIKQYPQHIFLFLTKDYNIYKSYNWPKNCWLGITIINQNKMNELANDICDWWINKDNKKFLSIEPIQEEIEMKVFPSWCIVGQESGNRKDKIRAEKEWIDKIINQCRKYDIPIFLKNNLKEVYMPLIQELPK